MYIDRAIPVTEILRVEIPSEIKAASSGFVLRPGQVHGTTTLCMTRDAANAKCVLNTATQPATNQLMQ